MSASPIPTLSCRFDIPENFENCSQYINPIINASLSSSDVKIHESVMDIFEFILVVMASSRNENLNETVKLKLTLSQDKGVEINNTHINEIIYQAFREVGVSVPSSNIESKRLGHLKKVEADKLRAQMNACSPEPLTYFHPASYHLFMNGVSDPITVDLELKGV